MEREPNGWNEWSKVILRMLEDQNAVQKTQGQSIDGLSQQMTEIRIDLVSHKAKVGRFSTTLSTIVSAVVGSIIAYFQGNR